MGPVSRCFKDQLYCMAIALLAFLPLERRCADLPNRE